MASKQMVGTQQGPRRVMGLCNVGTGVFLLLGVWVALPTRWMPVDVGASLLALLFIAAGAMLYVGHDSARRFAIGVASLSLVVGTLLCSALAITAGTLAGLYGPVGGGGAIILTAAAFLLLPYLVVFPAAQLYFLASTPAAGAEARADVGSADAKSEPAPSEADGEDDAR